MELFENFIFLKNYGCSARERMSTMETIREIIASLSGETVVNLVSLLSLSCKLLLLFQEI